MLGSFRTLNAFIADLTPGRWGPAADEAVVAFRPAPWELGRHGWLNERALREIAGKAGRHWLRVAGPRVGRERMKFKGVDEAEASGGCRAFGRLTLYTRLAGYEGGCWLLCHVVERADGRKVARLISRIALSHQVAWSAFPPYAAAEPAAASA